MDGYINFYKESGETSNKCLGRIKRTLNAKKAGFLGTLDPCAEGVLPIGIGFGTKLFPFFEKTPKTYKAEIIFGSETDTQDATGKVTVQGPSEGLTKEKLETAMQGFLGEIQQVPPMYSAKLVEGKRLYESARAGILVEREAKVVTIHKVELLEFFGNRAIFTATVSTGTYIRTFCEDLGRELGIPAHMGSLTRVSSHNFRIATAVKLSLLEEFPKDRSKWLLPLDYPLDFLTRYDLNANDEKTLFHGSSINWYGEQIDLARLYSPDGSFFGIGRLDKITRQLFPLRIVRAK